MSSEAQMLSSGMVPEQTRELLHLYEAVCGKLEQLAGTFGVDMDAELLKIKEEYGSLPQIPEEFAEIMNKRFSEAEKKLLAFKEEIESRNSELAELLKTADAVLSAGELATVKEVEAVCRKLESFNANYPSSAAAEKLILLAPQLGALRAEQEAENIRIKAVEELTAKLTLVSAGEDFNAMKETRESVEKEFSGIGSVPSAVAKQYQEALHKVSVLLAQHYETLDLARWESYTRKLDLLKEIENLSKIEDNKLGSAASKLQELRLKWKEAGSVPHEKNEEVNEKFLELTRPLQKRIEEYYSRRRQEKKAALEQKLVICAAAEALADSTGWKAAAEQFKTMQADWKQLPGAGPQEKELFARFRAAADKFFSARDAFYKERNAKVSAAKAVKLELIAKVAALDPSDRRGARALREEFKASENAGRDELELRKQFDAAMDSFFAAIKENISRNEQRSTELVRELENLSADPVAGKVRAGEIRAELAQLNVRNHNKIEREAIAKFDRAERKARTRAASDKFALYKQLVSQLNAELPAEKPAELAGFAKLDAVYDIMASGEDVEGKLEKVIISSRKTSDKILEELRRLSGNDEAKELTLAQELEAAIFGNFARSEAEKSRKAELADAGKLRAEFMGVYLPAGEFETAVGEFEKLFARISESN